MELEILTPQPLRVVAQAIFDEVEVRSQTELLLLAAAAVEAAQELLETVEHPMVEMRHHRQKMV